MPMFGKRVRACYVWFNEDLAGIIQVLVVFWIRKNKLTSWTDMEDLGRAVGIEG